MSHHHLCVEEVASLSSLSSTNASLEYAQVQPGPAGSNHLICQISHDNASLQERSQVLVCTAFTSVCDSTLHFAYLHWRQHVDGDFAQTGTDLLG